MGHRYVIRSLQLGLCVLSSRRQNPASPTVDGVSLSSTGLPSTLTGEVSGLFCVQVTNMHSDSTWNDGGSIAEGLFTAVRIC